MGTALVIGVSRRSSIGFAVARRLMDRGDRVVVQSWAPHEAEQPWGTDDLAAVLTELGDPTQLVAAAEVDACFAVNARGSLVLTQAFAAQHEPAAGPGAVVLFTSGQHRGPMSRELPYAISKGAVQQMTLSLADGLTDADVTVNCPNPGPTDPDPRRRGRLPPLGLSR